MDNTTAMSETDHDQASQPARRTQFPLWFLLFVIPTIAGLGFAIFSNWQEQARTRADLIAQRAILQDERAALWSEIALVDQVDQQIVREAGRWDSPDAVVHYLQSYHDNEGFANQGFYEVPFWHDINGFFLHADEADLHRLLALMRKNYPDCDNSNKYSMLEFAINLPTHSPGHVDALTEDAWRLAEDVSDDAHPLLKKQARRLRQAFPVDTDASDKEAAQ